MRRERGAGGVAACGEWRVTRDEWELGDQRPEVRGEKTGMAVLLCFSRDPAIGQMRHKACEGRLGVAGFSLVEVTVAIGIFAFVAVGILGLLPTALKMRNDSGQETRAVMIAQEIFSAIGAAPDLQSVRLRQGPGLSDPTEYETDGKLPDLTSDGRSYVFGYPSQTTMPNWRYRANAEEVWKNGTTEGSDNSINTIARVSSAQAGPNLRRITVEVRSPVTLPLENSRPTVFTSLFYSP